MGGHSTRAPTFLVCTRSQVCSLVVAQAPPHLSPSVWAQDPSQPTWRGGHPAAPCTGPHRLPAAEAEALSRAAVRSRSPRRKVAHIRMMARPRTAGPRGLWRPLHLLPRNWVTGTAQGGLGHGATACGTCTETAAETPQYQTLGSQKRGESWSRPGPAWSRDGDSACLMGSHGETTGPPSQEERGQASAEGSWAAACRWDTGHEAWAVVRAWMKPGLGGGRGPGPSPCTCRGLWRPKHGDSQEQLHMSGGRHGGAGSPSGRVPPASQELYQRGLGHRPRPVGSSPLPGVCLWVCPGL